MIYADKREVQGDGPFLDGINVTIRRNYIYEDAYDKLSPENGKKCPAQTCSKALSESKIKMFSNLVSKTIEQLLLFLMKLQNSLFYKTALKKPWKSVFHL